MQFRFLRIKLPFVAETVAFGVVQMPCCALKLHTMRPKVFP